jgi:hypothetical protein
MQNGSEVAADAIMLRNSQGSECAQGQALSAESLARNQSASERAMQALHCLSEEGHRDRGQGGVPIKWCMSPTVCVFNYLDRTSPFNLD